MSTIRPKYSFVYSVLFAIIAGTSQAETVQPQAEILHWWSSAGESAALDVFIDAFTKRGGRYYDSTKNSQVASRDEAIVRMSKGYPATLTQWNAGYDVTEFYDLGLIRPIVEPSIVKKLKSSLPSSVIDAVSHDGIIVAMPINVHSENWMWFSKKYVKHDQQLLTKDWRKFLDLGDQLAQKNIPLLAIGDQSWQVRIFFTSLFLGTSRETYKEFYLQSDPQSTLTAEFKQTLTAFVELARYSRSFGDGNWNTQVKAVAENEAGATFMGDWAKGEFNILGKSLENDYGCALTASNDPSLLLVIDTFILGKVQDENERLGQSLMLDIISDPTVNLEFNTAKGSVSPYTIPAPTKLDDCSAQVYEVLKKNESVVAPYASYSHGSFMHKIDSEIYRLWQAAQQSENTEKLVTESIRNFQAIVSKMEKNAIANIEE